MKKIENVEELRSLLEEKGIHAEERFNKHEYTFLIYYFDNKSNTAIYKDVTPTVEVSIRGLPKISKQAQIPVNDIDIFLRGCVDEQNQEFKFINVDLDYHIYFKDEPEEKSKE